VRLGMRRPILANAIQSHLVLSYLVLCDPPRTTETPRVGAWRFGHGSGESESPDTATKPRLRLNPATRQPSPVPRMTRTGGEEKKRGKNYMFIPLSAGGVILYLVVAWQAAKPTKVVISANYTYRIK
jgi:hypothetical protein